jgi:hypothetical protein
VYDVPSYIWVFVLIGVVGITGTTSLVLYRSAVAARLGSASSLSIAAASATLLGGFVLATGLLANAGVYHEDSGQAAPFFGAAFATVLVASLLLARVPLVRRILADPGTPARLALPHTFRFVGAVFLILMVQGDLPAAFALPAGLGDIAIAAAAPIIARRPAGRRGRTHAVWFNWLGILDLVVAVALGALLGLGPYVAFDVSPTTEPLVLLPLVLIPTGVVPILMALHIVSLRRLRTAGDASKAKPIGTTLSEPRPTA